MALDALQPSAVQVDVEEVAARCGVLDALLFRKVSAATWAHLGGFGRGRSWAGVVEVGISDPLLSAVPDAIGGVTRFAHPRVDRVLGPYYAAAGALVRVSKDVAVVLANPSQPLAPHATDDDLRVLATLVDASLEEVNPSKRLGDELEVLHAVRAVITTPASTLARTLEHIVRVALDALSCEVGAMRVSSGHLAFVAPDGTHGADHPELDTALDEVIAMMSGTTLCIQDMAGQSLPAPFDADRGVRSLLAVPVPAPLGGALVVAHTTAEPRGFTALCQRLGEQVADTASVIGHTAALREELRLMADEQFRTARTDALTGLGNRLCWDEALLEAQRQVDGGACVTVITLDIDGLKATNDARGHDAGDELLRQCAHVLREFCRDGDTVARLGGDEFALLLPLDHDLALQRLTALADRFTPRPGCPYPLSASVGAGTARLGDQVVDAVRDADAAMYAYKRARRADQFSSRTAV